MHIHRMAQRASQLHQGDLDITCTCALGGLWFRRIVSSSTVPGTYLRPHRVTSLRLPQFTDSRCELTWLLHLPMAFVTETLS